MGQCSCTDASCGCPVYMGLHFYGYDCRPVSTGRYDAFQLRLDEIRQVMEAYPFIKGAIVNEIGMLNCRPVSEDPICVPDSGDYPRRIIQTISAQSRTSYPTAWPRLWRGSSTSSLRPRPALAEAS